MNNIFSDLDSIILDKEKEDSRDRRSFKKVALESSTLSPDDFVEVDSDESPKKTLSLINEEEGKICTLENNGNGTFNVCCEDLAGNKEECETFKIGKWNKIYKEKIDAGFVKVGNPSSYIN